MRKLSIEMQCDNCGFIPRDMAGIEQFVHVSITKVRIVSPSEAVVEKDLCADCAKKV